MKKNILVLLFLLGCAVSHAQIGIGVAKPAASSVLELKSITKGFLPPRLTTRQRDAIASPAEGLSIFNMDKNCMEWYNGSGWYNGCGNQDPGKIATLGCSTATTTGNLITGASFSNVSSSLAYTGSNGGSYSAQAVASTVVTGLTATLAAGNFSSTGAGNLIYTITGTPSGTGTATFVLPTIGGQACTYTFTVTSGTIATLTFGSNTGTLTNGTNATGVSSTINYTVGNGGSYSGQAVTSTGVTGLTATLAGSNFTTTSGTLSYAISGTPDSSGTASFAISIGGQSLTYSITVATAGNILVTCDGSAPTTLVPITSATGRVWMDRNLGARRAATSIDDYLAYGCSYQWGRGNDGHATMTWAATALGGVHTNGIVNTQSTTDTPGNALFIYSFSDWRLTKNDALWQGLGGINNPCPATYRLPTEAEIVAEGVEYGITSTATGYASVHKFVAAGYIDAISKTNYNTGVYNDYWTSSIGPNGYPYYHQGSMSNGSGSESHRAASMSARCIKN